MTMEFLYRNATPAYRGIQAQPNQRTGLLAELGSVVGGGAAPAYKTRDGARAQAPAPSRSWMRVFAVTPSYKTAAPRPADRDDPCAPCPDDGDGDADPAGGCAEQAMQVVIL
jgi:hypothetical protein